MFGASSYSFTIGEHAAIGDAVGAVSATDPDVGDTVSYSITAGDGGKFSIDASSGEITVVGTLDHETVSSYALTLRASDGKGGTATASALVTVTDVNEPPVFDAPSYSFSIGEDAEVGDSVGTVSAADPDVGDTASYSITAGGGGKFSIDASTGEITVAGTLEYETTEEYTLTVEARDGNNGAGAAPRSRVPGSGVRRGGGLE